MATSGVTQLANLIPEIWSPKMYDELRSKILFANTFSREYEGAIKNMGDTVRVNQVNAPTGEILTDDTVAFSSELLNTTQFNIVANKRASAAFEISDLGQLQSMSFQAEAQEALVYSIRKQLENDIISALVPSALAPDHDIAPAVIGDLAAVDLGAIRTLMSKALIPTTNRKLFLDPQYYGDILDDAKVMSRDYTSGNLSEPGVADAFMGFQIMEHDGIAADTGFAVHPSALQLVMQQDIRIKISDLHSNNKYGYLVSADFVYGYQLFDDTRIVKISG